MRNTHPALFSANENRNRPKARTNVTNFRANATLPDKKSQGPLRMPGPFFVLYTDKVPIYGQNQPPKQDKTSETRRTSPALNRNRPFDTGNFRLPEVFRDGICRLRIPPLFCIRPVTDHNPCMGSRPPYGRPAKRFLKILSKNDKYFLIFKICSYICRRNNPKTKYQRLWIYSQ